MFALMSLHCSLFIRLGRLTFLHTPPLTNCSLLVSKSSDLLVMGFLKFLGRDSGCWTAPRFLFSGGFPVLTSSGTGFCIGLRSFKCLLFLLTTRSKALHLQPSMLSISSVTSPSLQFHCGRFLLCIKTSPVLIVLLWSPWVPQC